MLMSNTKVGCATDRVAREKLELVTVAGAGAALNLKRTSIYRLIAAGELEVADVLRRTLITQRSIDALILRSLRNKS